MFNSSREVNELLRLNPLLMFWLMRCCVALNRFPCYSGFSHCAHLFGGASGVHHAVIEAYICCWADVLPFLLPTRWLLSPVLVLVLGGSSGFISPWSRRIPIAVCAVSSRRVRGVHELSVLCVLYHHAGFEAYMNFLCCAAASVEHCCFNKWTSLRDAELNENCKPYNYRYCDRRMCRCMWWCMLLVSVHSVFL